MTEWHRVETASGLMMIRPTTETADGRPLVLGDLFTWDEARFDLVAVV